MESIKNHIKTDTISHIFLICLLFFSFVRFYDLGYSHFYGDETKILYLDKTIPATQYFLDQRKGPVQFLLAWSMEKITGGFDEFWIRFPFAFFGVGYLVLFYLFVKELSDRKTALLSYILLGLNGFSIAFSRTAQYQSVMLFFGFLALYVLAKNYNKLNFKLVIMSAISFGIALLSHYDAIFMVIPILYVLFKSPEQKLNEKLKNTVLFFLLVIGITSLFYLPYLLTGNFVQNTIGYLERRMSGSGFNQNNSWYTSIVYSPLSSYTGFLLLGLATLFVISPTDARYKLVRSLTLWFLTGFFCFQFIINNPGTHIFNYYVPLMILVSLLFFYITDSKVKLKYLFNTLLVITLLSTALLSAYIYVPLFNASYPWGVVNIGRITLKQVDKDYNLFLYGFPYNRGWDKIKNYFDTLEGVRGVYTNDNDTVAQYYLRKYDYKLPGTNFIPQYYIYIYKNQELLDHKGNFAEQIQYYTAVRDIYVSGNLTARIYKLTK